MKTFPTNFIIEKNKKTGASPVWILKCPFPSTGTLYLSDQVFTVASWNGGITTKSWVKSWGQIDENISGSELAISHVSDFSIDVIDDPNSTPNINTILWTAANNIETTNLELYLWFVGLNPATDPPQLMWVGNIVDFTKQDELNYNLQIADQSVGINKYVGTVIDATSYPNADPDEIGKVANILYGASKKVRCQAIKAGAVDTITADITATSPGNSGTLQISDASEFPATGAFTVQIDKERIRIASRSGNTLTLASSGARGYGGSTAAPHNKGAAAYQVLTEFVYLIADHPVKTIGDIFVDGIRQTTGVTSYTGQSANQHASYPGKAIVLFATKPFITKQVNLAVDAGNHIHKSPSVITSARIEDWRSYSGTWAWEAQASFRFDGDFTTGDYISSSTASTDFYRRTPVASVGSPISIRMCISSGYTTYTGEGTAYLYIKNVSKTSMWIGGNTKYTRKSPWVLLKDWADVIDSGTSIYINGNVRLWVYEMWYEILYDPTPPGSPATGVTLTGASVADTVIGSEIVATVDGFKDDASGTYTGTANALIERPNHIIGHFLNVYAGVSLANFSTNTNSYFSTNGYKFAIVINERKKLKEWLVKMAWQCRSYFRFSTGKAYLTLRPDSLTSQKSITANMIRMNEDYKTTTKVARSPLEEIINKIKIFYNRDWLKTGEDAYTAISNTSDSTSITRYGEKERPDLFFFDFVTTQAMADHVRNFYLARYKDRKKVLDVELFLDNSEIDFADALTIVPQSNLLCEVQKVNVYPGSGQGMRNDRIQMIVKEY